MDGAAKPSAETAQPGFWRRLRARLRFGLGGLVLFVLFLASLAAVWVRWEAWVVTSNTKVPKDGVWTYQENAVSIYASPDCSRAFLVPKDKDMFTILPGTIAIAEVVERGDFHVLVEPRDRLCLLPCPDPNRAEMEVMFAQHKFVDNDHIQLKYKTLDQDYYLAEYYRRHPEWWWGHFCRPEVWVAIMLGALWLWRVIRAVRARPAVTA
ncbi:MAG: hypothetical protein HY291_22195 [Planctomycetes bacterium]|nr:hypothetical protein [Planctomycetota bacterium]